MGYLFLHFLAGCLSVVGLAYVFLRFLRREPNLEKRRQAVFELNHRPARIEAAKAEIANSYSDLRKAEKQVHAIRAVLVNYVPLDDSPATKWAFAWLFLILLVLEAAVFFLLTAPSAMLGLGPDWWATLSPVVAAAWVLTLHVLMGAMVGDKHRPARTVRRAKLGAVLFGGAVVTAVYVVLSGRNVTDPTMIEQLTGAGLMVLAALLAVTSAFCGIVCATLFEAQSNERELEHLEARQELYARHVELLQIDLSRQQTMAETGDADDGEHSLAGARSAAPGVVPKVMLLLLLALPASGLAQARQVEAPAAVATAASARYLPFPRQHACELVVDVTISADRATLREAVDRLATHLPLVVDALGCTLVRVVPFAGDLFIDVNEIAVPAVTDSTACQETPPTNSASARAAEILYPRVAKEHADRARQTCLNEARRRAQPLLTQRAKAVDAVAERLRALLELGPRGPCTALYQVLLRSFTRAQHVIVLTDGTQTCPPPGRTVSAPADARVFFLLVPPTTPGRDDRANLLLTRLAELERAFPSAAVLLAPEATTAFWQHVTAGR